MVLGPKSSIEPLFAEQKKAVRALMPGYNCNYYKNGLTPCHTKQIFKEHTIFSVHSLILTKIILFMDKFHNYRQGLPSSVLNIISTDGPKYGNANEKSSEWLANHPTQKMRNALYFKGPLFYLKYMPEILLNCDEVNNFKTFKSFKARVKSFVFDTQTEGGPNDWEGLNCEHAIILLPGITKDPQGRH